MTPADELVAAAAAALRDALQEDGVAIDPRDLRPAELVRLLNSTPLGEVLGERRLRDHRARAGFRIGDGRHVDLFRYAAWLAEIRHQAAQDRPQSPPAAEGYEQLKERARARNAALSRSGRDIAPLPDVADPERRARALESLEFFLLAYFPDTFSLPFCDDHRLVIGAIRAAATRGGLFAYAMPRGSGKTSICERAAIWAALKGLREFIAVIGAEESSAEEILDAVKTELETNDLLVDDFPEVCYPIRRLEGITNRARGQLFDGERTRISWTRKKIILPTIPGSAASGVIIKVAGLTGRIRGMKHQRADGRPVRPSLVILDDPQTDKSADSPPMTAKRERVLAGAILGLAGPGKKIAAVCPCTVIRPDDMADRLLDHEKHPEWRGERCKMVYSFPKAEKLWDRYAEILKRCQADGRPIDEATEFYRRRRAEMDEGARVAWPERFNDDEISGIQHAMNLKILDEAAFFAERQNEPLVDQLGEEEQLRPEEIAGKLSGYRRGVVPLKCGLVTAMVDVHDKLLYWVASAWAEGFTGSVIDYGTWPKQNRAYFTLRDARVSMQRKKPGAGKEAAILAGLETLLEELMSREFQREDGQLLRIRLLLVDAGYVPDVVYQAIRTSRFAAMLLPSTGLPLKAANKPFSEYKKNPGDKIGHYWRIPSVRGKRLIPTVQIDTNYWKSRMRDRWRVPRGDRAKGSLELFGRKAADHRLYADHLCAEYFTRTEARGRTVDQWEPRPGNPDNHWLDCTVGNLVAASLCGITLPAAETSRPRRSRSRRRVSYFNL